MQGGKKIGVFPVIVVIEVVIGSIRSSEGSLGSTRHVYGHFRSI